MRNIIIGTAGHVDHGKTTLIKALTGIDTDRLKEEKERGMTIDLGFASLTLPNGQKVGIVDVPGHERFIKNMLAGAGGVDLALLVIAADESVMPQTVEHLEILQLLEVKRGVVALTKADMVDHEWLDAVIDDVRSSLSDTFLKNSPIIPVSSTAGTGLDSLLDALQTTCEDVQTRDTSGSFRLPVDRIFTLTGFGTVVTGTLVSGTIHVGDPVDILPNGLHSRVRQLQVHGHKMEAASAGTRVAINLAGLDVPDIERGDVCATPDTIKASNAFDLKLSLLDNAPKPLKNRSRVRLYIGTAELLGRLTLLDRDELKPGDTGYVQFKSELPAAALRGDRFVLRSYSPMLTVGGGVVLDPTAKRHKRFDEATIMNLDTSSRGTPEELLEQELRSSSAGIPIRGITHIDDSDALLLSLKAKNKVVELDGGLLMHAAVISSYAESFRDVLIQFHKKNPLRPGMPKEELRASTAKSIDLKVFASIISFMVKEDILSSSNTLVSLHGIEPNLTPDQKLAFDSIITTLRDSEYNPPSLDDLIVRSGLQQAIAIQLIELLNYRGDITKVAEGMYFHTDVLRSAEKSVRDFLSENERITVAQFRDLTSSSRKYALSLLEYFDEKRVTKRVGDERMLLKSALI